MTTNPLPGHADQPAEITCAQCGQFVGALTRCPRCGARVEKRMSIRVFRYAALALGTIGLGLLYLMATHRELPVVRIGEIKPTMNFAYVRVVGAVSGEPRVFKEAGKVRSLRFSVDDGTGEISVTAFRSQAEALVEQDLVPSPGDRVTVAGALSMTADDDVVMRLQVTEHLQLERAEVPVTVLGEVNGELVGNSILVEGTITAVNPPKPESRQPWVIELRDDSGEGAITFWPDLYPDIGDKSLLIPGAAVRARVGVRTYKDKLQLMLNRGEDLEVRADSAERQVAGPGAPAEEKPAPAAAAPRSVPTRVEAATEIADVTVDMKGKEITVLGRVAELRAPAPGSRAPYTMVLEDQGRRIPVVYWDDVATRLGENAPSTGVLMKVRGLVDVYEKTVQIKVTHSAKVKLVDVEPPAAPAPAGEGLVEIGKLTADMKGRVFTVRGALGEPRSLMKGIVYPLSDGTGQIDLLLWDRMVPGPERDKLEPGRTVKATGAIGDYQGQLQIVPASAQAVELE
ncbi:MAG TPA: hypothetical protein P5567_03870 [Kiritimatiellia bacterium]|nr:hypothetical protein [Kiritimatiellia bacterium]HRZ11574.1 hypothetical protein [Kiritimatiellia bacterium]HSA16875.1 hypothetical protein [Kiritimatiellia bacterium]